MIFFKFSAFPFELSSLNLNCQFNCFRKKNCHHFCILFVCFSFLFKSNESSKYSYIGLSDFPLKNLQTCSR